MLGVVVAFRSNLVSLSVASSILCTTVGSRASNVLPGDGGVDDVRQLAAQV